MLQGFRRDTPSRDLCRREGIRPATYYAWLKDFMEVGKERLQQETTRDVTKTEVAELKRDCARLKQWVAELSLQRQELLEWEKVYTTIRPHQALRYLTPPSSFNNRTNIPEGRMCHQSCQRAQGVA